MNLDDAVLCSGTSASIIADHVWMRQMIKSVAADVAPAYSSVGTAQICRLKLLHSAEPSWDAVGMPTTDLLRSAI